MQSFIGMSGDTLRLWLTEHNLFQYVETLLRRPMLPFPDNFTPPTRTPWGGTKILGTYKRDLPIRQDKRFPIVGESWEISSDPAVPCQFCLELGLETILIDFIQLLDIFPEQILGAGVAAKFQGQNSILVKMLDAADHLSVQVHPSNDYAGLGPDESGKPECWYILDAEPGSGLYFGLRENVSKDDLQRAIEQEEDVSQYLNFVEVSPGDFFMIEAGTIHAVGAGVTLIEPQKIAPRKSGKTYRLWDWNRRYDEQGTLCAEGTPRQLHLYDSLQVIDFESLRGAAFIKKIQPERKIVQQHGESVETLCVETEHFGVRLLSLRNHETLSGNCTESFHGLTVYEGKLEIFKDGKLLACVERGQSVILPAVLQEYELKSAAAEAVKVYYPAQYLS